MATDDKYDRQLRLWGAHGQSALMKAKICVLGSSPCATETLKNLVLPGVGNFTVVDAAVVELSDLGNNFFLEESDLGKPRAEAVCRLLQEMNSDVKGDHIMKDPKIAIDEGVNFFKPFSIVIACQLSERLSALLGNYCKDLDIPLILITSLGFIGKIRVFVNEHCVCETKPDSEFGDLRLTEPFPELRRFADSIDLDSLDATAHAHVPFVVILIRALDTFRKEFENKSLPSTKDEKERFKQIISGMRRSPQEVNFDEALENAYKAWMPYSVPEAVKQVLELKTANPKSDFWVVARALSQFVRDCGKLPLAGSLPDMTASTEMYVKLQEIYGNHAGGDFAAITAHVATITKDLGIHEEISTEYMKRFCQNAQYCEVFTSRSLEDEFHPILSDDGGLDLACECEDEDSLVQWYIALRAAERFREEHGHLPGALCADDAETTLSAESSSLAQAAAKVVESYKVEGVSADPKMLDEIVRCGGSELHMTSSVLGGMASQEAVKLITKQFSPLMGVLLYDGLHGKMQSIQL
eukprot:TRINITY_DN25353_c0_g4_i1.p1 TRINITY_DN25353_c0_g4~~TRINITY_DN25353_c0_g4_i1.p1  ORF type:complete len:525 (+),score=96.20 TRINITY_DN25353_c0_g4_i1:130-1704(+)